MWYELKRNENYEDTFEFTLHTDEVLNEIDKARVITKALRRIKKHPNWTVHYISTPKEEIIVELYSSLDGQNKWKIQ